MNKDNPIATFVRHMRRATKMSQAQLAAKCGVSIAFIQGIERGKESIMLNHVNKVLLLWDRVAMPASTRIMDVYKIHECYMNKEVLIELRTRIKVDCTIIIDGLDENEEDVWFVLPRQYKSKYKKTKDINLLKRILNKDIAEIILIEED